MTNRQQDASSRMEFQLNVGMWLNKILKFWWIFVASLVISVATGKLYLRYANFEYMAKAKLQVKGAASGGSISEVGLLSEQLGISSGTKSLHNEIQILSSRPILEQVVRHVNAQIIYERLGQFKDTEMYLDSPFLLESYELKNPEKAVDLYIKLVFDTEFEFSLTENADVKTYKMGELVETEVGKFKIVRNPNAQHFPGEYRVKVLSLRSAVNRYKSKLLLEVVGPQFTSSILELKLQDKSGRKAADFINSLIKVYNQAEVEDNIGVMVNTIDFIDKRIESLTKDLNAIEGEIERYKSQNELISDDVSSSLDFVLRELRAAIAAKSSLEVEQAMLKSLFDDLTSRDGNEFLIPVNIASSDPGLANLINDYNDSFLQRKRLRNTITVESPTLANLESSMNDIKALILNTLQNLVNELDIPLKEKRREIDRLQKNIGEIPNVQKELIEKLRMQSIKENLYLFLLEKKEETELSKAVYSPNTRVIEPAISGGAVYPRRKLVLMASVILGLLAPLVIVSLLSLFETKINSEEDINHITSMEVLARMPHIKKSFDLSQFISGKSVELESFRLLRTNLNYLNTNRDKPVILVTSSMAGEGKTSIALKLASVIAASDKKTVLVDLDMRRPKVAAYMNHSSTVGISNYLAGQVNVDEIQHELKNIKNLSIVTAGVVPPNPSELILADRMIELFDYLKANFDYVIVDSPPVGVVSDAMQLRKFVTHTLCIVRNNYTKKVALRFIEEMNGQGQLIKPYLVVNDVKSGGNYGGYSSKYGGGYYSSES